MNRILSGSFLFAAAILAVCAALVSFGPRPAFANDCGMAHSFYQTNLNVKTGRSSVWQDTKAAQNKPLLFVMGLHVATTGTRRSYSISDFWGEQTAINNVCNAMKDACASLAGNEPALRARRIVTQEAYAKGWPADLLAKSMISPKIIPFKDGKPCPLVNGYLVSGTSLHKRRITDVCDLSNYVDALIVPAFVLPQRERQRPDQQTQFEIRGARVGDLVVALAANQSDPVFGVVGDSGPENKLGEASVAMNSKLNRITREPVNRADLKRNWVVPSATVLIFPATRNVEDPYMTVDRINADAKRQFDNWGGVTRLKACTSAYTGIR